MYIKVGVKFKVALHIGMKLRELNCGTSLKIFGFEKNMFKIYMYI